MIVVDSSVWIAAFRGIVTPQSMRLKTISRARDILLGDIVLLEILQGAQSDGNAANLQKRLAPFQVVPMLSPDIAIKAAANFCLLRSKGITIRKTADLIIGTYCMEHGHSLLHADRDFNPMAEHLGLRIA
ncbi:MULTISPECIES: type II toxin-antitoxin system VapC family toxin [unclassified Shinella]|uniref:type II toxin-antitoxin system VapC family toxin n=1 Tax=unclassified Shinella TaxID=2643062 RepID=UPI00234EFC5F|nr:MULTISPECIES: PIN domain nuclease [unclassified Shinella]MCO5150469.1 PIN domain nuclease [Shinella sp.]MDC7261416.1 PIN domain nuclease [Shinella sp. HY16]MDC7268311.1 PIN domain nuclease [Shinella sp. YZ44]